MNLNFAFASRYLTAVSSLLLLICIDQPMNAQPFQAPGGKSRFSPNEGGFSEDTTVAVYVGRVGWNLVSLPVDVSDSTVGSNFYPYLRVFGYRSGAEAAYFITNVVGRGRGYWLKFDTVGSFSIRGTIRLVDTIDVSRGWNLIGSLSRPFKPVAGTTVRVIPSGRVVIAQFPPCDWGYPCAQEPGTGFWVKVISDSANPRLIISAQ